MEAETMALCHSHRDLLAAGNPAHCPGHLESIKNGDKENGNISGRRLQGLSGQSRSDWRDLLRRKIEIGGMKMQLVQLSQKNIGDVVHLLISD